MRGSFAYLVKQDGLRWKRPETSKYWFWFYVGVLAAVGICVVTFWSLKGRFEPLALLFLVIGLPYITFMIAYSKINREWKNSTFGWWLTLPYPRIRLVGAKYLSALLQVSFIYGLCYVVTVLIALYGLAIEGSFGAIRFYDFMKVTSLWYGVSLAYAPFMLAFGLLTGTVAQSRWKPLLPILWAGFGIGGNLINWLTGSFWGKLDWVAIGASYAWSAWLATALPITLLLSALLVWLSAEIVDKHLTT